MNRRRDKKKQAAQRNIDAKLAAFLESGGKVQVLPGFGQKPADIHVRRETFGNRHKDRLK